MPITKKQAESRRKHIGSSDVAALFDLDPHKTAYDVWLHKTGRVDDVEETDAMTAGRLMEDALLQYAAEHLGSLRRNVYRSAPDIHLGAHIDAVLVNENEPIEAKLSIGYQSANAWGEPGADQVPDGVILQCQAHMVCMAAEVPKQCHVVHYDTWRLFTLYVVPASPRIQHEIAFRCREFWEKNVLADVPPEGSAPSLAMARSWHREPGKLAEVREVNVIEEWLKCKAAVKEIEKRRDEYEAQILAVLGDAEGTDLIPAMGGRLTYMEQTRKSIDVKRLRAEQPEIAKAFEKETPYRVLRWKEEKPKGESRNE